MREEREDCRKKRENMVYFGICLELKGGGY